MRTAPAGGRTLIVQWRILHTSGGEANSTARTTHRNSGAVGTAEGGCPSRQVSGSGGCVPSSTPSESRVQAPRSLIFNKLRCSKLRWKCNPVPRVSLPTFTFVSQKGGRGRSQHGSEAQHCRAKQRASPCVHVVRVTLVGHEKCHSGTTGTCSMSPGPMT